MIKNAEEVKKIRDDYIKERINIISKFLEEINFFEEIINLAKKGESLKILRIDYSFIEKSKKCGLHLSRNVSKDSKYIAMFLESLGYEVSWTSYNTLEVSWW